MTAVPLPHISRLFLFLLGIGLLAGCHPDSKSPVTPNNDGYNHFSMGANFTRWKLSSVPTGWEGGGYSPGDSSTWLRNNDRRAKTTWYIVDNLFYRSSGGEKPASVTVNDIQLHYVRAVGPLEIHPERDLNAVNLNETVFNLAYYPSERGQYNYNPDLTPEGQLKNPQQNWGSISSPIPFYTDFGLTRIAYLDFWMMDPFITGPLGAIEGKAYDPSTKGREGILTLDLGDISEDVLHDGKLAFEQGLPYWNGDYWDRTPFGHVARGGYKSDFDYGPDARLRQDVGLDGLQNEEERAFFKPFLDQVKPLLTPEVFAGVEADPSADDFRYFLHDDYEPAGTPILERYKRYNNLQGNSPLSATGAYMPSFTSQPDMEDIDQDLQLNLQDGYYSYQIPLSQEQMVVGQNYILEKREGGGVTWYHYRIPIQDLKHPNFGGATGPISDFKRIRFMRLRMTGMAEPVVLRFVGLDFLGVR